MTSLVLDVRYAARLLVRHLGVTTLAGLTLALAIGAATAIFSVVYGVLLRPLPYQDPSRLAAVWEVNHRGTHSRVADPNFADFRDHNRTFASVAKYTSYTTAVVGPVEPTRSTLAVVSRAFFRTLGVEPVAGRAFGADDAKQDAAPTAVVSHAYWVNHLGSNPELGRMQLRIEARVYSVIGVMPAGFAFPAKADVWVPAELDRENTSRTSHNFTAFGRLAPGVSIAQARADIQTIARGIIRASTEQGDYLMADADVVSLQDSLTSRVGSTLYILLGAVFFLLLVACANVTNLLLSQASARGREIAVRHALGAGRTRLVRQFVIESLLLVAGSAAAGLLLAWLILGGLLGIVPSDLPRVDDVSLNWGVMAAACVLAAIVAVSLGLITSTRATRHDPRMALGEGGRGQAGTQAQHRLGRAIVTAQVAITMVLLIGAGLLGRSLMKVLSVDPGFRTDHVVAMDLPVPEVQTEADIPKLSAFYSSLFDRLRGIPSITDVAAANALPLDGGLPDGQFLVLPPSQEPKSRADFGPLRRQALLNGTASTADYCAASPDYFHALGIPLRKGRLFADTDGPTAGHVALITESLARTTWPGRDPIGQTIEFGNMDGILKLLTIVGVVGDTHEYGLDQAAQPTVYVNLLQRPRPATVVLRGNGDPAAIATAARAILHEVAPDVPPRFRTLDEIYATSLGARRFNLTLVGAFAVTALVLAVAGVYGVMAYNVSRRRREIGVRMALGATPARVQRGVLAQGLVTTVAGVVVGVAGAFALSRTLASLLFDIQPHDVTTFVGVAALLSAIGAAASYVPAMRATRVDPIETLRQE
jgi:predicted permease